nr:7519_t:CDS:2 [Entrophospora candida]
MKYLQHVQIQNYQESNDFIKDPIRGKLIAVHQLAQEDLTPPVLMFVQSIEHSLENYKKLIKFYIHRIGRINRAGKLSKAITYYAKDDAPYLKR